VHQNREDYREPNSILPHTVELTAHASLPPRIERLEEVGDLCRVKPQVVVGFLVQAREKRQFHSIEELVRRVLELSRGNLRMLAEIGALNQIGGFGTPST
jgi:hypothetical protein